MLNARFMNSKQAGFTSVALVTALAIFVAAAFGYGVAVRLIKERGIALPSADLSVKNIPPAEKPAPPATPPPEFFNQELRQNVPELKPPLTPAQKSVVASLPAICAGSQASIWECYELYYKNLVDTKGVAVAFADLRPRYDKNPYVKSQCHPLTHVIGRAAAKKYPDTGAAYNDGDSFCWSGYYHGVLEGIVGIIGRKNLPTQLDTICANLPDKASYGFNYYNCVHGLGHGLMAITNDELFDSLVFCDKLTGQWEQVSCASGVYMENIIEDGKNHQTKYLRPEEPLYPCNASPEQYKNTCYLMQTSYMLKVNGRDFVKTFAWCNDAGDYRNTCYESLGRDASGGTISDVAQTRNLCLLGPDNNAQLHCVIGAAKDFVSFFHSDTQAKALCASFSDALLQEGCLGTVTEYYKTF